MTIKTQHFAFFQATGQLERMERGVELQVETERLRVEVLAQDVIRLKMSRGGVFDETPSMAVCSLPEAQAPFKVDEQVDCIEVVTAAMTLRIGTVPFDLSACRRDGSVIFESVSRRNGASGAYGVLNDAFVIERTCQPDDAILGLGEKTHRLNRQGRNLTLWNTDILSPGAGGEIDPALDKEDPLADPSSTEFDPYYISIPFYYHLTQRTGQAAGFFIDNPYRAHYHLGRKTSQIHFCGGHYTEYIFAGPAIPDILKAYAALTGTITPPPLWALGHHQCRWHRYSQDAMLALAKTYRKYGIPCDVLWLDIHYMDGFRVFTWDEKLFPDHAAMLAALKQQGLRVISIIDPGVKHEPGYPVFDEGVKKELFCMTESGGIYNGQVWPGRTAFVDYAREDGRRWWGELNARHVQSGLAGIWNDMNEPATGDIPYQAMRFESGAASHEKYHNQFATLMAMGTVEGLRSAMPELRTFVLSRAGSPGIQRYAANWMGDNFSRWDHLWMSIPMAMGLGLSGQPFVGADVGGFANNCEPELLGRWYQYGALTPFFRNHNSFGCIDQYPWSFGDATCKIVRDAVRLRYHLMPYIYTAFMAASRTGAPIQRPLVYDYQYDRGARDVDDQYLFGDHLLVAPVYAPGTTKRAVYLPEGDWYDRASDALVQGGRTIHADTPPERIPVFVQAGAVIPQWPDCPDSTMDYHPERIDLHVYLPVRDGTVRSRLHEDDGLTFDVADGKYLCTELVVTRSGPATTIAVTTTGEGYPAHHRIGFRLIFHGMNMQKVSRDGTPLSLEKDGAVIDNPERRFELSLID